MANMDNEIRPISQVPACANSDPDNHRNSWRTAPGSPYTPGSPYGDFKVNLETVTEEREIQSSDMSSSSNSSQAPKHGYREKSCHTEQGLEHDPYSDGIDWMPGVKHQFPWIGFADLMVILVATAMAVAILVSSHKQRVTEWPFTRFPAQPNVLLNIANQVQNLGLITLVGQGLAIAWWRKALRGSSLKTLHKNHAYSYSFYAIVTSGKHFNIIALAALMTKFAVIDSTLFQKATEAIVTQQKDYANVTMTGWIATNWVPNKDGIPGQGVTIKTVDSAWANVLDAYNGKIANGKVHDLLDDKASFFGCPYRQECSGHVRGLGFAFNCSTSVEDVDYGRQRQIDGGVKKDYELWDIRFTSAWANEITPYASINLDMLYVDSEAGQEKNTCPGTKTRRSCEIRPAVVQYSVTVMVPSAEELAGGNIVTHIKFFNDTYTWPISDPLKYVEQIDELEVLEYVHLVEHFNETSTVGVLTYMMNILYSSSASLTYDTAWGVNSRGASAQTTFYADIDILDEERCWYNIGKTSKDDPTVESLRKINTLSFVTGLYINGDPTIDKDERAAKGMASQEIIAVVKGIVEEYLTNFSYVGGALAATFITVMIVLPVYWGFWQLGRKVTLGPLDISQAFGAPIIAPDKTRAYHVDFDQVLMDVGDRGVQYGQLKDAPPGQMGLAEPERVVVPSKQERWRVSGRKEKRRVGMGAVVGGVLAATFIGNTKD